MKYDAAIQGLDVTYKMISEDQTVMRIEPFLGVSIDGSHFVPVQDIINQALRISDLTLKPYRDRVEYIRNWNVFFKGESNDNKNPKDN